MTEPTWQNVHYPPIDYQDISYYSAPKKKPVLNSLDEVDPELRKTFEKLGHSARRAEAAGRRGRGRGVRQRLGRDDVPEQAGGARHHLLLVLRGGARASRAGARSTSARSCRTPTTSSPRSTRPSSPTAPSPTSRRACAARWSCRTYFRINAASTGQFERTLIVADEGAYVSYLEGCTAPMRDENQLHAAVVELVALDDATIKYSTVQNWYPGDAEGQGRHLQLRHQARQVPRARTRRSPGRRSRPARRSRGSTRAASCRATTRSASSTRWR